MELLKNLEGMTADEQMTAVLELQKSAMAHLEEQRQISIGKSAELVIQGLKKIKSDFEGKFDSLNYDIQSKVASLKNGEDGKDGLAGKDGPAGRDGLPGRDGKDGKDGQDGQDGADGVSVVDARIDFDGSLVITLSTGREMNVGEVVAPDLAEKIKLVTSGGGTSQQVLDTLVDLQDQINVLTGIDGTLGTMAQQDANAVAITGGSINNTVIGNTTPNAATFTTLTATGDSNLNGNVLLGNGSNNYWRAQGSSSIINISGQGTTANINQYIISKGTGSTWFSTGSLGGNAQMAVSHTASAVNYAQVTGAATTGAPTLSSQGSDTNINMSFVSKGSGGFRFFSQAGGARQFQINNTTSAVNYPIVTGSVTGAGPVYSVDGTDTNIGLNLTTKGTGAVNLSTGNGIAFQATEYFLTGTTANYIFAAGRQASNPPVLGAAGSDTNISLAITSKGTGGIAFTTSNGGLNQFQVAHTASAVNFVQVTGSATGGNPIISAQGSDANISLQLNAKGSGGVRTQFFHQIGTGYANFVSITGNVTTVAPSISAGGSDTNIDLALTPKGTGNVRFGTYTANMALTIQGYVEIKDAGGTIRRLAVIA